MPAYNAARTLSSTLRSVLEQQTEHDFEVVVLDNASTDGTGDIAAAAGDPRVRVVRNDAVLAIGDNWNKAVSLATGELIKVVCADDTLLPGCLAEQSRIMDNAEIAITATRFEVIDEDDAVLETGLGLPGLLGRRAARELIRTIVRDGPAEFGPTAAAMFRRAHFDAVGGFRGDLVFPMDVDLFARVGVFGQFHGSPMVGAAWRNSRFNLCSRTSTRSKLTDMLRFHHRLARSHRAYLTRTDVAAADLRLAAAALNRLRIRALRLEPRPAKPASSPNTSDLTTA
ncbi:MAG: glycosyltransferase [Mycobacteriaceae bacterium]|nr:glycosyltransferase [Mycobacteriaceae bacterium]